MITHNGKYLLHATHHGMPIYAATMGGKMVIGDWLLSATLQAIVAAFGAEVIAKTNDYLNRIATTDPQRALQLAGFINEDPLLVCSLVETSKTRWLVGDGKAYVDTGVNPTSTMGIETDFIFDNAQVVNNPMFFGARNNTVGFMVGKASVDASVLYVNNTGSTISYNIQTGTRHHIKIQGTTFIGNGTKINCPAVTAVDWSITICGRKMSHTEVERVASLSITNFKIFETDQPLREMYPFIRNGEAGMLDIISGTFHPNANTQGSFTIAITDKTPA